MKAVLKMVLPLLLLTGAVSFLHADDSDSNADGYAFPHSQSTPTTALNGVTATVQSSVYDLATKSGAFLAITSSTGQGAVTEMWADVSTTASNFRSVATLPAGFIGWRPKHARFVQYKNNGRADTKVTLKMESQDPNGGATLPNYYIPSTYAYVGTITFSGSPAQWTYGSLSATASDSTTTRNYRFQIRNEGASSSFYLHNNAITTPTARGVTLTANTPTQFTQFDDVAYDTNVWVSGTATVDVWKR